jgi:tRNA A-37 threonylcarbamoyl transferase component Bud32
MDEDDSDSLDKLAADIADGGSIDWEEIGRLPADDPRRQFLEHLRVVADIAEHHRSAVDGPSDNATTETGPNQRARVGHVRLPSDGAEGQGVGRWGHLLLRRRIGAGAFGEVFHAHDVWLDHPVALKLLKPEIAQSDFSNRILHEARRLARVRHPNVVNVHGADMHEGRIGFWMDLIEGETLTELVARGRLSHGEASHIGREVCLALAAVHGANLIHRDVKAQNVMRAFNGGRIILMDFGAGEFMDRPSSDRRMRGTPLYLAPELFERASASVASDVYATGVLLFYLVTGGFPVTGSSIDALADAHRRGERKRLRDERPDLPDSFVSVVERALDRDPARRFSSAGEMYEALGGGTAIGADGRTTATTTKQTIVRTAVAVAGLAVFTEILGWLSSQAFESALRIDRAFVAGPIEYFGIGLRAFRPFVMTWVVAAASVGVLVALTSLVVPRAAWRQFSHLRTRADPGTVAGLVVAAGVVGLIAVTWQFSPVWNRLTALALDPKPETLDLSILGWAGRDLHSDHSLWSATLSFALVLAVWRWFPRLEKRAADPARVRGLRWAAIVVILLVVAEETITRPFLWDRREIVTFKNQNAFVIGMNTEELLLYTPARGDRKYIRVRVDAPDLRRNVGSRALFLESDTATGINAPQ